MASEGVQDFDDVLKDIAKEMRKDEQVDDIGKALGISIANIGGYKVPNKGGSEYDGSLKMLRAWYTTQSSSTVRETLKHALEQVGRVDLCEKHFSTYDVVEGSVGARELHAKYNMVTQGGIADELLVHLASDIETDEEMKTLGKALGFKDDAIDRYTETNMSEGRITCKGTHAMLIDWRNTVHHLYQQYTLHKALKEAEIITSSWNYLKDTPKLPGGSISAQLFVNPFKRHSIPKICAPTEVCLECQIVSIVHNR